MADVDWKKIKTDYITDEDLSYTKLSGKYGVSRSTIANRAGKEKWPEQKEQYQNKVVTKTLEKMSEKQANRLTRIQGITDRLLDKLETAVEELNMQFVKRTTKTKEIEYNYDIVPGKPTKETINETEELEEVASLIDRKGLQAIASALRDIKEVQMLKSDLDQQEQEARIRNLRRQADADEDKTSGIEIVFAAGPEEWNE